MKKAVLFDLDGTILDTGAGIMRCARQALEHLGIRPESEEALRAFVGPPLRQTFAGFGVPGDRIEEAVAEFRRVYNAQGKFEEHPYPGIEGLLKTLKDRGFRLFVATSKPEHLAKELLKYAALDGYFEAICGAVLDGSRDEKAKVIRYLLDTVPEAERAVMVGDTAFDVIGARAHGIDTVGVSWGYGSVEQMRAAGAVAIADTMDELLEAIARA